MSERSAHDRQDWVSETVNDASGWRTLLRAEGGVRVLDSTQDLCVFQNPTFGKVMMLDGAIQVTTSDEFIYHEMMAHVPLLAHGAARRVLVVGGGDGGIAREVLRHPGVETLDLVEIDRAVVDLALAEFASVSDGAFRDPRLTLHIADGTRYVREAEARYDAIIVDSPDPIGAGKVLFEAAFYRDCARLLGERGVMVTQSGIPFLTPDWFAGHAATLREVFGAVSFYLSMVPSYSGGAMAHGFLRRGGEALPEEAALQAGFEAANLATRYYTPAVHRAAFALPPYIADLAQPPTR